MFLGIGMGLFELGPSGIFLNKFRSQSGYIWFIPESSNSHSGGLPHGRFVMHTSFMHILLLHHLEHYPLPKIDFPWQPPSGQVWWRLVKQQPASLSFWHASSEIPRPLISSRKLTLHFSPEEKYGITFLLMFTTTTSTSKNLTHKHWCYKTWVVQLARVERF